MSRKTIITIVGARPQFIKAAAVSRAVRSSADFREILVHTGQHFDDMMSDVFFRELDIPPPDFHFSIHGGGHGEMTGRMLEALERPLAETRPDWVLVYGDTNSTLAGALAAAKLNLPVVHVEAGLRSFNRRMPEELNRVVTDHVSTLLLTPTTAASANLAMEGITRGVYHVGDVMFDAMLHAMEKARSHRGFAEAANDIGGPYVLATIHRAENTDNPVRLAHVIDCLKTQSGGLPILWPMHPRTRQAISRAGLSLDPIRIIEPVGYLSMAALLDRCALVMTDSGGLQKEAYFARRPCITLRDETEWVETVTHGWNRLWTQPDWQLPRRDISDYGNGHAADQVLAALRQHKD